MPPGADESLTITHDRKLILVNIYLGHLLHLYRPGRCDQDYLKPRVILIVARIYYIIRIKRHFDIVQGCLRPRDQHLKIKVRSRVHIHGCDRAKHKWKTIPLAEAVFVSFFQD